MMLFFTILFGVIMLFLWLRWKGDELDDIRIMQNRDAIRQLAYEDYEKGILSKEEYRYFGFVTHPSFRSWMDYVPPERQAYTSQMEKTDKNFWKTNSLTPDFKSDPKIIYELYKQYVKKGFLETPELFRDSQFRR